MSTVTICNEIVLQKQPGYCLDSIAKKECNKIQRLAISAGSIRRQCNIPPRRTTDYPFRHSVRPGTIIEKGLVKPSRNTGGIKGFPASIADDSLRAAVTVCYLNFC